MNLEQGQLTETKTNAEVEDVNETRPSISQFDVVQTDTPSVATT